MPLLTPSSFAIARCEESPGEPLDLLGGARPRGEKAHGEYRIVEREDAGNPLALHDGRTKRVVETQPHLRIAIHDRLGAARPRH